MQLLTLSFNIISIFATVSLARDFGLVKDLPPSDPAPKTAIPQREWGAVWSILEFPSKAAADALTFRQLGYIGEMAFAEMVRVQYRGNVKAAPGALAVMRSDKRLYLTSSVRSTKGRKGLLYRQIDPDVPDSVDQVFASLDQETKSRHHTNALCAEYQAFRKYDKLNRPAGTGTFVWPPTASTTFCTWGQYGFLAPCNPPTSPDNKGLNPTQQMPEGECFDYGCLTFLKYRGYIPTGPESKSAFKRLAETEPIPQGWLEGLTFTVLDASGQACSTTAGPTKRALGCNTSRNPGAAQAKKLADKKATKDGLAGGTKGLGPNGKPLSPSLGGNSKTIDALDLAKQPGGRGNSKTAKGLDLATAPNGRGGSKTLDALDLAGTSSRTGKSGSASLGGAAGVTKGQSGQPGLTSTGGKSNGKAPLSPAAGPGGVGRPASKRWVSL